MQNTVIRTRTECHIQENKLTRHTKMPRVRGILVLVNLVNLFILLCFETLSTRRHFAY